MYSMRERIQTFWGLCVISEISNAHRKSVAGSTAIGHCMNWPFADLCSIALSTYNTPHFLSVRKTSPLSYTRFTNSKKKLYKKHGCKRLTDVKVEPGKGSTAEICEWPNYSTGQSQMSVASPFQASHPS